MPRRFGSLLPIVATTILLVPALALAPSPLGAEGRGGDRLRILSAASLTDVIRTLVEGFRPELAPTEVELVFGPSSGLARQLRDGAPADVFLSASPDWMDLLAAADLLDGEPVVFARNRLVCIASQDGPLTDGDARSRIGDPRELLARLGPDDLVAIAASGVPAGDYARTALRNIGLLESFSGRLVGQRDVRAVLHAVERGELPAGFVYATDAREGDVETLFPFDPATHPPIVYPAAVLRRARVPEAAHRFVAFLRGETARSALARAGFVEP